MSRISECMMRFANAEAAAFNRAHAAEMKQRADSKKDWETRSGEIAEVYAKRAWNGLYLTPVIAVTAALSGFLDQGIAKSLCQGMSQGLPQIKNTWDQFSERDIQILTALVQSLRMELDDHYQKMRSAYDQQLECCRMAEQLLREQGQQHMVSVR